MSDNLPNITLVPNTWTNLYFESNIPIGVKIVAENLGAPDIHLADQKSEPTDDHNAYNILKRSGPHMANDPSCLGAWGYCSNATGKISIRRF